MIQKIRTLWRKIVPPKALATQLGRDKHEAETVRNRRVQVTVERETVSMWVRGQPTLGAEGKQESGAEAVGKELPPPTPSPGIQAFPLAPEEPDE